MNEIMYLRPTNSLESRIVEARKAIFAFDKEREHTVAASGFFHGYLLDILAGYDVPDPLPRRVEVG